MAASHIILEMYNTSPWQKQKSIPIPLSKYSNYGICSSNWPRHHHRPKSPVHRPCSGHSFESQNPFSSNYSMFFISQYFAHDPGIHHLRQAHPRVRFDHLVPITDNSNNFHRGSSEIIHQTPTRTHKSFVFRAYQNSKTAKLRAPSTFTWSHSNV